MKDSFLNKKFKYTYSNACIYIVLINVLVFMLTNYTNIAFKGLPLVYWISLVPSFVNRGWIWQFVTYMFVHGSMWHLFFNMFALIMFGRTLERSLGTREFLLFYFLCGILGGVVSYLFYLLQGVTNVVIFPNARLLLFFVIPIKMPFAVMLYILIEVFSQVYGVRNGVAHLIHLSCILIAWIYVMVRFRLNPIKIWKENL